MMDLQVVFVREIAELTDIKLGAMVRIDDEPIDAISDIQLNGVSSSFFALDSRTIMVNIPASFMRTGRRQDMTKGYYGYVAEGINNVRIVRSYTGEDGNEYNQTNTIVWDNNSEIKFKSPPGTRKVTLDTSVVRLKGNSLNKAVAVRVNNKYVPFVLRASGELVTVIPENDKGIHSVDVITKARSLSNKSFFEYTLGKDLGVTTVTFKLVQQFLKVLMTTPGTDAFNKTLGGNMQNWVGQRVNHGNPQGLISRTVLQVVQTGVMLSLAQARGNLPPEERLTDVQVISAQLDPDDPSAMNLALRLNTFAGRAAYFNMILSEVQSFAENAQASIDAPTGNDYGY